MSNHADAVKTIILLGRTLEVYDIPQLIEQGQRALDFGPFQDPTLWIQKHQALEQDLELLRAALPLATAIQKLKERIQPIGREGS